MRLKERLMRFMYGRYGVDGLGRFLLWVAIACMLLSWFVPGPVFYVLALLLLVWGYFRMFSRNIQKRYQENCVYYRYVNKVKDFFKKQNSYRQQRKTHHIYKCPQCKQKIRVPKRKGRIAITCKRCGTEFIKNSR
ncbi:MAG: hypothetical protein IKL28_03280 [Lachnospiraceae bacterium]|nr:hypothetical protein [Lachnospiraceae bacterium]